MKRRAVYTIILVLLLSVMMIMLCGCGDKNDGAETDDSAVNGAGEATVENLTDEQALSAIKAYCIEMNPSLEEMINDEDVQVYWDVESSDEQETVIMFRSYTGAEVRYYIDRTTGETYSTEYVSGVTDEEQRTDEEFNVRDYLEE